LDRFTEDEIHKKELLKSSVARKIKKDLADAYPSIEKDLEILFPKKESMVILKTREHVQFIVSGGEIWFFNHRGGPYLPTLRTAQKCTFFVVVTRSRSVFRL
jgi:PUA domain protein